MTETLSIDHLILEKRRDKSGSEYMRISRLNQEGKSESSLDIKVGDGPAAYGFLSQMAELLGVNIVAPAGK